jgi:hypothetical protein
VTLVEFLGYVKEAGGLAGPIFAVMWWLERGERLDAQKELKTIAAESVRALVEFRAIANQLTTIFGKGPRR